MRNDREDSIKVLKHWLWIIILQLITIAFILAMRHQIAGKIQQGGKQHTGKTQRK